MPTKALPGGTSIEQRDPLTAGEQLEKLRAERDRIEAAIDTDPLHRAADPGEWHDRENRRKQRLVEIERETRRYELWSDLADPYSDAIHAYNAEVAPLKKKHAQVMKCFKYDTTNGHEPPQSGRDVEHWLNQITALARRLPHTNETSRAVIAREMDQWVTFRIAWLVATVNNLGRGVPPLPEFTDQLGFGPGLPDWLHVGVHRLDRGGQS